MLERSSGCGCAERTRCRRRLHAVPVHVGREPRGRAGAGSEPGDPPPDLADHAYLPGVCNDPDASVQRAAAGRDRGESPGQDPWEPPDGPLQ